MSTFLQDLKFGARLLAKTPGFTAIAALSLALATAAAWGSTSPGG